MSNLPALQKLDAVLRTLKSYHDEVVNAPGLDAIGMTPRKRISEIMVGIVTVHNGISQTGQYVFDSEEIRLVLLYLVDEKYCLKHGTGSDTSLYEITFAGLVFCERGGYTQQQEDLTKDRSEAKKNARRVFLWTIAATVVAGLLLIVEAMKFIYDHPDSFPFFWRC